MWGSSFSWGRGSVLFIFLFFFGIFVLGLIVGMDSSRD